MSSRKKRPAAQRRRTFKSPIEVMLRNGIVSAAASNNITVFDHSVFAGSSRIERSQVGLDVINDLGCEEWGEGDDHVSLYGDVAFRSYRLDFVLVTTNGLIAIECDGREFHDRTKQQAAYDRARDRELLAAGIPTIRFTGSEIHHSIERCVADVYAIARSNEEIRSEPLEMYEVGVRSGRRLEREEAAVRTSNGPTGAELDAAARGFSRGISHACTAMSVEFNDLHPEEHF